MESVARHGNKTSKPVDAAPARSPRIRPLLAGAAVVVLCVLAVVAWRRRGMPVRRDPGLSVLLVTVDTLRADALGCYGHPTVQTPWIDALARDGVRFESAHAQNVVTLPSHANILTGRYPLDHGIRDNSGFRLADGVDTLATRLKQAGYRTGAFISAFPLDSRFGLARGFDVYDDQLGDPESRTAFVMQERPGSATVAAALRWLSAQGDAKTFTWVHIYEPHFPYRPPEPFASRYAGDLYHGEVAAADGILRPLLEPLLQAGTAGHTLVVLTGDHGEGLGEHGEATHGIFAYEATLHIPLILFQPRLLSPRIVKASVRHVDVLPTVVDAVGLTPPADLPGRSLLSVATGHDEPLPPGYFEALSAAANRGWAPLYGLLRERYKLIELPLPELYDLGADPHESRNLAASQPGLFDELRGQLGRLRAADRGAAAAPEARETRERLQALGYVSAATPSRKTQFGPEDDPKRLIALDAAIEDVVSRYQQGDLPGAITQARVVVAQRPDMPLSLQHLAFLLREAGDLKGAVAALRRSVAVAPEDIDGVGLLGGYLNELGQPREAVRLLAPYVERKAPDLDVMMAYGAALAQAGQGQQALAVFERARGIDPTNPMPLANAGTVHLMQHDYDRARQAMEAALALDPGLSRAHNALGVVAMETGHRAEAIEHWKRAVELNPNEFDTLFNLGKILRSEGREAEARAYLERFVQAAPRGVYGRDIEQIQRWLGPQPAGS